MKPTAFLIMDETSVGFTHPTIRDRPGRFDHVQPITTQAAERRGVVLVLILGMLGLLALIGVTFATFSGQARISRGTSPSPIQRPPADRDDGLRPVATDRRHRRHPRRRSAGHSLTRDMYGNDATNNGFLAASPRRCGPSAGDHAVSASPRQ